MRWQWWPCPGPCTGISRAGEVAGKCGNLSEIAGSRQAVLAGLVNQNWLIRADFAIRGSAASQGLIVCKYQDINLPVKSSIVDKVPGW